VLPISKPSSIQALREVLGTPWFTDYVVTAEALRGELAKKLGAGTKAGPLSPDEARALIKASLAGEKKLGPDHAELLLDAVLAASRGDGDVKEAFDWVISTHRPKHDAGERPLETKLYRVNWEKRHGDTLKGVEGILRTRQGEFFAYDVRSDRRELSATSLPLEDGYYMFAIDREGRTWFAPPRPGWSHPTLIGGREPMARGAGEFLVVGGKIAWVNDGSGHFVPRGSLGALESHFSRLPAEAFHPRFRGYLRHQDTTLLTASKI
jgi:hypothetical protein